MRSSGRMPFFAPLPPEPEPVPREERVPPVWQQPPAHEVPVAVPITRLLARVPGAALTLQRIDVHRDGALFALRTEGDPRAEGRNPADPSARARISSAKRGTSF